jgi:hypothetical protein
LTFPGRAGLPGRAAVPGMSHRPAGQVLGGWSPDLPPDGLPIEVPMPENVAMPRPWLLAALAIGVIAMLYVTTGRGGGVTVDGPVVAHDRGWGLGPSSGMDALVGGTLEHRRGCLLLDGNAVVWPDGTGWDPEQQTVRLSDGSPLYVGGAVVGGGGMVAEGRASAKAWKQGETGRALAGCLAPQAAVVVFNATADLEVED